MTKEMLDISRMNLEHLKTFHVVATLGSFTEAAKTLFLTQPAVTQQIQGLEHALKSSLFDRTKRQIRLTSRGKVLFKYTQKLFGIFREIENVFNDLNSLQAGELTIAASAVAGNYYISEILPEFTRNYPLVSVRLELGDSAHVVDLVEKGVADIGLCRHLPTNKNCVQKPISREPYICVCAPNYPLASLGRSISPQEFAENYIVMRQRKSKMRSKIEEWFSSVGAIDHLPPPTIEVNNLESSKRLVSRGLGACAFPYIAVRDELKREKLVELRVDGFSVSADYFLTIDTAREMSPAAFKFIALLEEKFKP